MAVSSPSTAPVTAFSRDVLGRFVCNGLDEVRASQDTSTRPDARPFNVIVIGGGTFGAAFAQHLFFRDHARRYRVLVLEAGPFLLPEHAQNLPMLDLNQPGPTSIADLRKANEYGPDKPRREVWGLPWHSPQPFIGLAYCLGGRSLYWGGWSPQPLPGEMPPAEWPAVVVSDLTAPLPDGDPGFFRQASQQIGVAETNDFIFGPLHDALRARLLQGVLAGDIADAVPLNELPLVLDNVPPGQEDLYRLEAPLAVQGRPPRSGFFSINKFSTAPLLVKAARAAYTDSGGDNVKRRLMVVPFCHVQRLVRDPLAGGRVARVETNQGPLDLPPDGIVVIALGTLESTRLALLSFQGIPSYDRIGQNLIAHLRSNLTIRVPRGALPAGLPAELQVSALFLKGRHQHGDGSLGHFHLQITAAGLAPVAGNAEAELFQKVPDIDTINRFETASDQHVVIHLRGIGEMTPQNSASCVSLDPELDEFNEPRAFVSLTTSANDQALWEAMDTAADEAALVFAGAQPFEVEVPGSGFVGVTTAVQLRQVRPHAARRDGLGTTHHEAGSLWMGAAGQAVTNADGRFHDVPNAFVAGPAVFPTVGSPNPMLTGIALTRRLVRHVAPNPVPYAPADGVALFDGFATGTWRMAGKGSFLVVDGTLESVPGDDLGLYWCTTPTPADFVLRLEWLRWHHDANSGVFIRFPDPRGKGYGNQAYVAVDFGFEIQIDELGRPAGAPKHRTGAVYGQDGQNWIQQAARAAGQWNEFAIFARGQQYEVHLNGALISEFANVDAARGLPSAAGAPSFIGLQSYPDTRSRVAYRNIRVAVL
jgi:hypothetical protein